MERKFAGIVLGLLALLPGCRGPLAAIQAADIPPPGRPPELGPAPPMPPTVRRPDVPEVRVEIVAAGLEVPWDLVFLSRNRILITERPGRIRLCENGRLDTRPYHTLPTVDVGEGGLMGMALDPHYPQRPYVYVMYTYRAPTGRAVNRVSRFRDTGTGLADETVIFDGIRAGLNHNGGGLRFGPDGMLYISTGDAWVAELAQELESPCGKILRIRPDGTIPADNPFPNSPVYALGLRNVQGMAWHPETKELWVTNHGPSGELANLHARDSVYIVRPGSNCGWPRVLGVTRRKGIESPILYYPDSSVPPGAAIFYTGDLFPALRGNFLFCCLGGEHLQRVILDGPRRVVGLERWWEEGDHRGRYGRLRTIVQGPDGALYLTTTNRDGRGIVRPGDDKVLRVVPAR